MIHRHHHLPMAALVLALAAALAFPATARSDDDLSSLLAEPVETTASKSAGTAASSPALSISVTAEDLRRYGIRTLAEAYNFLVMGLVSQDPLSEPETGGRGLMFTNDQNKHILLLIDGHATNNQESGASLHGRALGLPMEVIDHIEVVLGPGAVLYGSNAMLGVVNVVTKRAKDYSGLHAVVEGALSPPLDRAHGIVAPAANSQYLNDLGKSLRLSLGGAREFELRGRPAELTAQFQYYTLDGPALQWGPQNNPGANFGPYGTRASWGGKTTQSYYARIPSGYARLVVGEIEAAVHIAWSRISQPVPKRTQQVPNSGDFNHPDVPTERLHSGVDLKWRRNLSLIASLAARLYGDWSSETSRTRDHAFFGCVDQRPEIGCAYTQAGYARSIGAELQWGLEWPGRGHMSTLVGADVRLRQVGFQNGATEVDTGRSVVYSILDGTQTLGAVYAQHVYHPNRWLTVNGGLRLDADNRFGSRLLPRAAVVTEPWAAGTLKAIYSQAFRAPTVDEVNYRNPNSALASEGLRPESVRSVEAVLQQRFGTQSITFGVYRSWWTDMIVQREFLAFPSLTNDDEGHQVIATARRDGRLATNVQVAYQYQNITSIDNFGFNGGYDGSLVGGRLVYGFNLTAGYARFHTPQGTQRVPVAPAIFGNARVSFDLDNRLPVVAVAAHFSDRRLSEAGDRGGFTPIPYAPAALDLRSTATGPFPGIKRLSYQVLGNYAFASSSPYTAGPNSYNPAHMGYPELVPTLRFTLMLLLQYDLDGHR